MKHQTCIDSLTKDSEPRSIPRSLDAEKEILFSRIRPSSRR